jgi:transmembrane sensor
MTTEQTRTRELVEEMAASWIARRDSGDRARFDQAELDAWLAESVSHRVAFLRLEAVWEMTGRLGSVRRSSRFRTLAIAAAVAMAAVGIVLVLETGTLPSTPTVPSVPTAQHVELAGDNAGSTGTAQPPAVTPLARPSFQRRYHTAVGASQTISLPDGSRVTLDTDTQLRVSMDAHARTVQLDRGQAFFDVAHDVQRPFVVHADRLSVTAVGTAFAVRRVASDVHVVVEEGTVRLDGERQLPAGGVASVENDTVQMQQVTASELQRALSWRDGVLAFRHASLADAVAEMNRYGSRQISIRDPQIASLQLGGVIRTDDVESFVYLIERTLPVDAALQADHIELNARRSP